MKFLFAAAISAVMLFSTVPANANNNQNVVIGILGGALGGLIVGEVLGSQGQPVYAVPPPPQYYDPYVYEQPECITRWYKRWDPNQDRYIRVRKVICN